MKYLLPLLLFSGCSASYSLQPFQKEQEFTKEEIVAAFNQRDRALEVLAKRVEALEPKKKENKK